jgi:hypothetical protein
MTDKLVEYKTAKLLKKKGFDIIQTHSQISSLYDKKGNHCYYSNYGVMYSGLSDGYISAPTQSLAQKWLREIHGIHIVIIPTVTSHWTYKTVKVISEVDNNVLKGLKSVDSLPPYKEVCANDFQTYEDALEDGIYKSLKLIAAL